MLDILNSTFSEYWNGIIGSIIISICSIIAFYVIRYFLRKMSKSLGIDREQIQGIVSVAKFILSTVAVILIIFQFSTTSGIIASTISLAGGTIVGFASINTVGNAIAGFLLLLSRPFKIGDRIRLSEDDSLLGDVMEITLIYTKIKTAKNELVSIPNQMLLQRHIINYSGLEYVAVSVDVSMGYNENKEHIESLLIEAAKTTQNILDEPKPFVILKRYDNFAAVYELRAYTGKPNELLKIQSELRKTIFDVFKNNNLDLTTPNVLKNTT